MGAVGRNFIAGEWCAGESELENRNPSDISDLIGLYAQASATQLDDAIASARSAQAAWAQDRSGNSVRLCCRRSARN